MFSILNLIYFCTDKVEFSAGITPSFNVTWFFSNVLNWCSFLIINVENSFAVYYFCGNHDKKKFSIPC